jgi:hypothetical protein
MWVLRIHFCFDRKIESVGELSWIFVTHKLDFRGKSYRRLHNIINDAVLKLQHELTDQSSTYFKLLYFKDDVDDNEILNATTRDSLEIGSEFINACKLIAPGMEGDVVCNTPQLNKSLSLKELKNFVDAFRFGIDNRELIKVVFGYDFV